VTQRSGFRVFLVNRVSPKNNRNNALKKTRSYEVISLSGSEMASGSEIVNAADLLYIPEQLEELIKVAKQPDSVQRPEWQQRFFHYLLTMEIKGF
jgi:hypothetical protein